MLRVMTCCAYCEDQATTMIPSNPEHVCLVHALEFWTGLMAYARERRRDRCVKEEQVCTCASCAELVVTYQRPMVSVAADQSPRQRERMSIRLAS
jgi:hypothetical protein